MVLDDVAKDARLLVEPAAVLDADGLGDRDLDVVDVTAVPERLEDPVAEAEDEDVLRRLLAEVVVDAEDLALAEDARELLVEGAGRREVAPERLLDDDARPRAAVDGVDELRVPEVLHDRADHRRRDGEVEHPVAGRPALLLERLEARLQVREALAAVQVAAEEEEARLEGLPLRLVHRLDARELGDGLLHLGAVRLVGLPRARVAHDAGPGRKLSLGVQLEERGDELPLREVARASEDDDRRGLWRRGAHDFFTVSRRARPSRPLRCRRRRGPCAGRAPSRGPRRRSP